MSAQVYSGPGTYCVDGAAGRVCKKVTSQESFNELHGFSNELDKEVKAGEFKKLPDTPITAKPEPDVPDFSGATVSYLEKYRMYSYGFMAAGAAMGGGFSLYRSATPSVYNVGALAIAGDILAWGGFRLWTTWKEGQKDYVNDTLKGMAYDVLYPLLGERAYEKAERMPASVMFAGLATTMTVVANVVLGGFDELAKAGAIVGMTFPGAMAAYNMILCIYDREEGSGILECAFDKTRTDLGDMVIALMPKSLAPDPEKVSRVGQMILAGIGITAFKLYRGSEIFDVGSLLGTLIGALLTPLAFDLFGVLTDKDGSPTKAANVAKCYFWKGDDETCQGDGLIDSLFDLLFKGLVNLGVEIGDSVFSAIGMGDAATSVVNAGEDAVCSITSLGGKETALCPDDDKPRGGVITTGGFGGNTSVETKTLSKQVTVTEAHQDIYTSPSGAQVGGAGIFFRQDGTGNKFVAVAEGGIKFIKEHGCDPMLVTNKTGAPNDTIAKSGTGWWIHCPNNWNYLYTGQDTDGPFGGFIAV